MIERRHPFLSAWRAGSVRLGAAVAGCAVNFPTLAAEAPPSSGVDVSALVKLTLGLLVVLGVILLLAFFLKRSGGLGGGLGGQLRVLGAVSVGNRERVVLLKAGKTQLLVGVAPGRVQTLHVLDEPLEVEQPGSAHQGMQGSPFAQRLHRMMRQHEKHQ